MRLIYVLVAHKRKELLQHKKHMLQNQKSKKITTNKEKQDILNRTDCKFSTEKSINFIFSKDVYKTIVKKY